jgi:hypothetical protein
MERNLIIKIVEIVNDKSSIYGKGKISDPLKNLNSNIKIFESFPMNKLTLFYINEFKKFFNSISQGNSNKELPGEARKVFNKNISLEKMNKFISVESNMFEECKAEKIKLLVPKERYELLALHLHMYYSKIVAEEKIEISEINDAKQILPFIKKHGLKATEQVLEKIVKKFKNSNDTFATDEFIK